MATKTFEELKTSGTLPELTAYITANTKAFDAIKAAAMKREDKAYTAEDITEMTRLDTESEELQTKAIEIKRVDDMDARNKKRAALQNTPVNTVPQNRGNGGVNDDGPIAELPIHGSLKNITAKTGEDAYVKAHRFGQFLLAASFHSAKAMAWCDEHGLEYKATINEGVNEQGGVLVPEEFSNMLINLRERYGVFRPNSKIEPMGSETRNIPRRTSGVTTYWVGEGKPITGSVKGWDNVQLTAKKLTALVVYSSEIQEDAVINIADDLAGEIAYAFSLAEDQAGFNGDGTSAYGGITGVIQKLLGLSATIANIAGLHVGAGNAYSEQTLADFNAVMGLLPVYADTPNTAWYMHKSVYHNVAERLANAAGGVTAREVREGNRNGRPLFLGYPVNFTQVMPSVEANSQVCALFGDLSLATTFGDRRRITLFTDPYSLSANDQILLRGTERVDENVHDVGNASATASQRVAGPITGLITAAA